MCGLTFINAVDFHDRCLKMSRENNQELALGDGRMTHEDFKLWSANAIKKFLSLRKKPTDGSFEELVSRAFVAYEEDVPIDVEKEELERRNLMEYKKKLVLPGTTLPDPLGLKKGWIGELEGIRSWPSLYIMDISKHFCSVVNSADLIHRLECEYKEGKAYRYFSDKFVKEVFIHKISPSSKFCIMKTKCTPSQRISMKPYDVWAIIRKDGKSCPGGEIVSAYCSCTAGLLGSCNHVAGMLFRIEAAVITGVTNPTCTGRLSEWVVPSSKANVKPGRISDMVILKEHYKKKATSLSKDAMSETMKKKLYFNPASDGQSHYLKQSSKVRFDFYEKIKGLVPGSCFEEFMDCKKFSNVPSTSKSLRKPPPTMMAEMVAADFTHNEVDEAVLTEKLINEMKLSPEEIDFLYKDTVGQSENQEWLDQRKGRLTASKFKRIFTRACTLELRPDESTTSILSSILGYKIFQPSWQMKHGIGTEIHAKTKYLTLLRTERHRNLNYADPGLQVMADYPFIAASTDLDIDCHCCGKGHAEFKCPASVKDQIPTSQNLAYLEIRDGETRLKKNSEYYFQIQGQMGVTGRQYTDFFVFTFHGYHRERIAFEKDFWSRLLCKLIWFWTKFVAPEMLHCKLKKELESHNCAQVTEIHVNNSETVSDIDVSGYAKKAACKKRKEMISLPKKRPPKKTKTTIFLCGICNQDVAENPATIEEESIGCDLCPLWYHFKCAGITEHTIPSRKESWICSQCSTQT